MAAWTSACGSRQEGTQLGDGAAQAAPFQTCFEPASVEAGESKWSVFPYDILYLLNLLNLWLVWFSLPANPALWPFLAQ